MEAHLFIHLDFLKFFNQLFLGWFYCNWQDSMEHHNSNWHSFEWLVRRGGKSCFVGHSLYPTDVLYMLLNCSIANDGNTHRVSSIRAFYFELYCCDIVNCRQ